MSALAAADAFHAHLDACERCRERPFDLCATGAQLLVATAQALPSDEIDGGPYVCPGCHAVAEPCAPGCVEAEREEDDLPRRFFEELDDEDSWGLDAETPGVAASPPPEREPRGRSHSEPPDMHEDDIPW